jgi:hypothetical protein
MNTKEVILGGEPRPVKFGFNALIEFSDLTGRSIEDLNSLNSAKFSLKDLLILAWCALKQGARKEAKEFTATVEDVGDWLDDTPDALVDIMQEYNKSRQVDPKQAKKKVAPRKR